MPSMAEMTTPTFGPGRCAQCGKAGVPLLACDDPEVAKSSPIPGQKPRFCNTCMIGKKVRVFWPVDESWYTGTVQKYDTSTGEHLLQYPDGDTEWVKIGENNSGQGQGQQQGLGPPPRGVMSDPFGMGGGGDHAAHMMGVGMEGPGDPGMLGPYGGGFPPHGYPGSGGITMSPYPGMGPHGMPGHFRMYPPYGGGGAGGVGGGPPMFPISSGPPPNMSSHSTEEKGGDGESARDDGQGSSKRKTGPKAWTKEEDALLLSIVRTMQMPMKWSIVAQSLPDRTGKQCRERYVNHLNPRLKVTDWNTMEDSMIFHLYNSIGSHWAKMSKIIPGRTDNGIKNRFHNLRRQFEREDEHRLRLSTTSEFKDAIRLDRLRKFPISMEGQALKLWDMHSGIGILAAQSIMGGSIGRSKNRFGPFRKAKAQDGEMCVRCGFFLPSLQTGDEICEKSGWCQSCSRVPPHISSNLLRECINLRREQNQEMREIVESWEEFFQRQESDDEHEDTQEGEGEGAGEVGSEASDDKASVS